MIVQKLLMLGLSGLVGIGLTAILPAQDPDGPGGPPPPPKKKADSKKKEDPGPEGDLRRAYDLLRKIKTEDGPAGRSDERLRDWTNRAAKYYRRGIQSLEDGDPRLAHEYGTVAHDLARAVDHTRNASRFDRPDPDLPSPPEGPGSEGDGAQARHDLRRAYDRIREWDNEDGDEAFFYINAARDLYSAARTDLEADRHERGGELARAAEAMTHVPEHLAHAASPPPDSPPEKKERPRPPHEKRAVKGERPDPKAKADDLPPPLPRRD